MTADMWITLGIALILLILAVRGAFRGFAGEVAPLGGLIVCGLVIYFGYAPMQGLIEEFVSEERLRYVVFFSALGISLVGILCYFLVSAFIRRVIEWIIPQPFNAILGALLSCAKGVLFVSIIAGLYTLTQEKLDTLRKQQEENPLAEAALSFWKDRLGQAHDKLKDSADNVKDSLKDSADNVRESLEEAAEELAD